MFKYTEETLKRYEKMIPKADYSCLEKFLRTVDDASLFDIRKAGVNIQQGKSQPSDQLFVIVVLANIFLNEYGQKEFSGQDYLKLFPVFLTSVFYEAIYRYKTEIPRIQEWRELRPSQISKYRVHENV